MTARARPLALLALLLLLAFLPASAALGAQTEGGEVEDEVVVTELDPNGPLPAEPDVPVEVEEVEQPWTARFLIPALTVTAVLVVGGVAIYYFARIKNRYRVVEG